MPYKFDEHDQSQNAYFDIARGHFQNVQAVNLFGFNEAIGTDNAIIKQTRGYLA